MTLGADIRHWEFVFQFHVKDAYGISEKLFHARLCVTCCGQAGVFASVYFYFSDVSKYRIYLISPIIIRSLCL